MLKKILSGHRKQTVTIKKTWEIIIAFSSFLLHQPQDISGEVFVCKINNKVPKNRVLAPALLKHAFSPQNTKFLRSNCFLLGLY